MAEHAHAELFRRRRSFTEAVGARVRAGEGKPSEVAAELAALAGPEAETIKSNLATHRPAKSEEN